MVEPAVSDSNSPRTFSTKCPAIPAARKCSEVLGSARKCPPEPVLTRKLWIGSGKNVQKRTSGFGATCGCGRRCSNPGSGHIIRKRKKQSLARQSPPVFEQRPGRAKAEFGREISEIGRRRAHLGMLVESKFSFGIKLIWVVQSPSQNIRLTPSRPTKGALAIVTDAGRDAVDAENASDEGI